MEQQQEQVLDFLDQAVALGIDYGLDLLGAVAIAVVVAGLLQIGWMLVALRGRGWWARDFKAARAPAREVLRRAGPMILGLGVLQLNTFFDSLIASYPTIVGSTIFGIEYPLQEGALAAVSYEIGRASCRERV